MIIKPKTRGFICTTAHPKGCAKNVEDQIAVAKRHDPIPGPTRVLVLGASTGYGLASRITASFCCGADTIGVFFERPSSGNRTATAGWYNSMAFERAALAEGRVAVNINGDAFSNEVKAETVRSIREHMPGGQVDLVVYSLAAPKRKDPATGEVYSSVIKPVGHPFAGKTIDFHTGEVSQVEISPASGTEAEETVAVMGGADWLLWMKALRDADVLAENAGTFALSYLGPDMTHAIYKDGTIGLAKQDLEEKAKQIDSLLAPLGGKAFISVNKALVTQASAAIPIVPLYMSILFREMKQKGSHEGCIEQMLRLFSDRLYKNGIPVDWSNVPVDSEGRIRLDDWEMDPTIQEAVAAVWPTVSTENVDAVADLVGYREDFFRLFGFGLEGVNYDEDLQEY